MTLSRTTLLIGLAGSVLLHVALALAIVVLATGRIPGFAGTAGNIFMVSYDEEGAGGSSSTSGLPAFSSRPLLLPPRIRSAETQRLKNLPVPASSSLPAGALAADSTMPGTGGPAGGGHGGILKILSAPKPPYPIAARRSGFEGRTLLDLEILPDGSIARVTVERSSGRADCDESARSTIESKWRFAAFSAPGPVHQSIAVRFALQ